MAVSISIVITFYNKGDHLRRAIDSAIRLVGPNDEIIVINDCSTDLKSIACFQDLTQKYLDNASLHFHSTDKNLGASGAKNYGINVSKGEIITLLDADDELIVRSLDIIREAFSFQDVSFVFGDYIKEEQWLGSSTVVDCSQISVEGYLSPKKVANNWILLGSSPFRKSVFQYLGGYDVTHPRTDDVDFQRKAILAGYRFKYISEAIYKWKISQDGNNSSHSLSISAFSFFRNAEFFYQNSSLFRFLLLLAKQIAKLVIVRIKK